MPRRLCGADVEQDVLDPEVEEELQDSEGDDETMTFEMQNGKVVVHTGPSPNAQSAHSSLKGLQPNRAMDSKVLQRIQLGDFGSGGEIGHGHAANNRRVINDLQEAVDRGAHNAANSKGPRGHDRSERATVESVLDPRTRLLLYKLVNTGLLAEINGCVSAGKEAHVYFARRGDGASDAAVKVYNTSILVFKDREKYVNGEFRFQRYCKSNPRKMVRTWAEKEARNLARLRNGGVNVPQVILLRQHILVMEFLGENGWPAPKLKDVRFGSDELAMEAYIDLVSMMRRMHRTCRLVHGDLSEYNLLYHQNQVVIIDVSQSVEHDHPEAIAFLRRDVVNVSRFFRSKGLARHLPTLAQLFFVVTADEEDLTTCDPEDHDLGSPNRVPKLNKLSRSSSPSEDTQAVLAFVRRCGEARARTTETLDDEGFDQEIARFMEVQHRRALLEEDAIREGERKTSSSTAAAGPPAANCSSSSSASSEDNTDDDDDDVDEDAEGAENDAATTSSKASPTLASMTKEERKEHQRRVKEEKRLKRTTDKVPKHKKKRACQMHKKK